MGIEARLLSLPVAGIGRYTAELINELVRLDGQFHIYTPKKPVGREWRQENVCLRSANVGSRIGKLIWSFTQLPYWARQDRVDVFWGTSHRLPSTLPRSLPKVVTIHDMVWKYAGETMPAPNRWLEQKLMPQAIRSADRIIADSHFTARAIKAEYPDRQDRVRVVHLGTPKLPAAGDFQALAELGIDQSYFLFVGTLEPRKNLRRLLQAYSLLCPEVRQETAFVVVGGRGWGDENIAALIKQMGLHGQVILTGYVSDAQLATLYAHARFLAMPSLYEGFGLPVLEAMSFGIPVLTSADSSMSEIAGDAAVFVDPLDGQSIYNGLSELLCNRELRNRLAGTAQSNAKKFSWQRAAEETYAILREAVADAKM